MTILLIWLPFLEFFGAGVFGRWLRKTFLTVKCFFINLVFLFFVTLVLFSDNSIFFVFCDAESQLVTLGGPLNIDNHSVKEIVVDTDRILLEKINNLSENLKDCQKKNNELETEAKINGSLGVILACVFLLMLGLQLYKGNI